MTARGWDPLVTAFELSVWAHFQDFLIQQTMAGENLVDDKPVQCECGIPPLTDQECCDSALLRGWDNGAGGGVVCCYGREVACNWIPGHESIRGNIYANKCVIEHEIEHFSHREACLCGEFYRGGFAPWMPKPRGECLAYTKQLECLRRSLRECGGDVECNVLNTVIRNADGMASKYCREAGML